jgi:hypothetical protein
MTSFSSSGETSELVSIQALAFKLLRNNNVSVNAWASLEEMIDSIEELGLEREFEQVITDYVNSLSDEEAKKTIELLMTMSRFCYCNLDQIFCSTSSKSVCLFIADKWFDLLDLENIQDILVDLDEGVTDDALWRLDIIQSYKEMDDVSDNEEKVTNC